MPNQRRTAKAAGSSDAGLKANGGQLPRVAETLDHPSPALIVTRDYLRLVQAFAQIEDHDLRQAIIALVERLAASQGD